MEYYERIKNLREDKDMKQKDVSEMLYVHKNTYYNYENGNQDIPFSIVIKLSEIFDGVSIDYIAGKTPTKFGDSKLEPEQENLLLLFNQLSLKNKYEITGMIKLMIKQQEDNKAKEKGIG